MSHIIYDIPAQPTLCRLPASRVERYLKWRSGINPDTGRVIKIGGNVHNRYLSEFTFLVNHVSDVMLLEYQTMLEKWRYAVSSISMFTTDYEYVEYNGGNYGRLDTA